MAKMKGRATQAAQARIILGLDATASRQPTWDTACELQAQMYKAVPAGIKLKLIYFRGDECKASGWFDEAGPLEAAMRKIMCVSGLTQIGKVLRHARMEHAKGKVAAVIHVGDMAEEPRMALLGEARELGGVPVFIFQEGNDEHASSVFAELAKLTGGAHVKLDGNSAKTLGELLQAVVVYADGGLAALSNQNTDAARLLLTKLGK
jgi:hypothetical protein